MTGPSIFASAASSAATRAAQLSLSCSSGGTETALGSLLSSSVCQCSATWSRNPGTIRMVGVVIDVIDSGLLRVSVGLVADNAGAFHLAVTRRVVHHGIVLRAAV